MLSVQAQLAGTAVAGQADGTGEGAEKLAAAGITHCNFPQNSSGWSWADLAELLALLRAA